MEAAALNYLPNKSKVKTAGGLNHEMKTKKGRLLLFKGRLQHLRNFNTRSKGVRHGSTVCSLRNTYLHSFAYQECWPGGQP